MQSLRQVGAGILLGVISVVIVLGGLTLALAEGGMAPAAVSTDAPTENTPSGEMVTVFPTLPLLIFTDTPQGLDFTATASLTPPPTPINCPPPAGWLPIVTKSYDTLASLAQTYHTTADLLRAKNCLLNDQLIANSILYVPAQPTATRMPCGAPLNWGYYTVVAGDTIYHIGLLYRVTPDALMQANCLYTSAIRPGQVLRVPNVPTSTAPVAANTPSPTLTPALSPTEGATTVPPTISPSPTAGATETVTPTPTEVLPTATEIPSPTTSSNEALPPSVTPTPEY